jgi:hypothetical protein
VALEFEQFGDEFEIGGVVVNDQDFRVHAAFPSPVITGSTTVNTLPLPGSLSTLMRPRWNSMIFFVSGQAELRSFETACGTGVRLLEFGEEPVAIVSMGAKMVFIMFFRV